jgi:uncharacterized membrane protein YoaK (UPF0700 family)
MARTGEMVPGSPPSPSVQDPRVRVRDNLLIALTFAAGVVDAVSYLGLGQIFTANMTGNVVFLALAVGGGHLATALHSIGALAGFCLGALLAGQILDRPRPADAWPRKVTTVLFAELACMIAFAGIWALTGGEAGTAAVYLLIGLSSVGMGLQNAAARHLAVVGLTTTVITTAITGFMVDLPALGVSGSTQRRTGWAVIALFSGAAVGAGLMLHATAIAPAVTVIAVGSVVVYASWRFRETPATAV